MTAAAQVLLLPGLGGSGAGHWQAVWSAQAGFRLVEQSDWRWPRRGDWMARLDEVLLEAVDGALPALLVARGLGCELVAAWAAHTRHAARVAGALLVEPHDTETDASPQLAGWRPMTRRALPFASTVAAGGGRHCAADCARELATGWGSGFVLLAEGEDGEWTAGRILLDALAVRAAESLRRRAQPFPAAAMAGHRSESGRPGGTTP